MWSWQDHKTPARYDARAWGLCVPAWLLVCFFFALSPNINLLVGALSALGGLFLVCFDLEISRANQACLTAKQQ